MPTFPVCATKRAILPVLWRDPMNRTIRAYPAFSEFYRMEEKIERIVGFLRYAAQGLEARKQIMYSSLLGPLGGGKSSPSA